MSIPALVWRTESHPHFTAARRSALGYWPGWEYRLEKFKNGTWLALFLDESAQSLNTEWHVIGRGNFIQARAACIAHHNHPE